MKAEREVGAGHCGCGATKQPHKERCVTCTRELLQRRNPRGPGREHAPDGGRIGMWDSAKARLAPRKREVVEGAKTFTAFSAHDLLDMDSHAKYGRPGMPY